MFRGGLFAYYVQYRDHLPSLRTSAIFLYLYSLLLFGSLVEYTDNNVIGKNTSRRIGVVRKQRNTQMKPACFKIQETTDPLNLRLWERPEQLAWIYINAPLSDMSSVVDDILVIAFHFLQIGEQAIGIDLFHQVGKASTSVILFTSSLVYAVRLPSGESPWLNPFRGG